MRTSRLLAPWRSRLQLLPLALALGALPPALARASPSYPEKLQEVLDIECAPRCTLCHRDEAGGFGTLTTPFGEAIAERGALEDREPGRIPAALRRLENPDEEDFDGDGFPDDPVDGDGDGMHDVEELRQSRDPNVSGAGVLCGPVYGCGASVAPAGPSSAWPGSGLLAAACMVIALALRSRWR